jgi:MoxR-like ATPase
MKQKIQALLSDMNAGLIDREQTLKAALLTVLAAENLVLIGPPGTAKSMVSRRVAQHIQTTNGSHPPNDGGGSYFEYLLTKFSTPEEIFGPLSISELKADRFRRNTAGYLPTAEIAFLDEIFKSSSSILNSLLTILNERVFHNGNQPQHVPLRSLISASNELPSGQEELSALYDRFLMRIFVGPVREEHLHLLFDAPGAAHQPTLQLTAQDFQAVDTAVQQVRIPPEVGEAIRGIWAAHKEAFKEDWREYLSDRRLVKLLKLLRVSAATNQRTEVDLSDAMLLQNCLWNHPDKMDKVREIVITMLQKYSPEVPVNLGQSMPVKPGNSKILRKQIVDIVQPVFGRSNSVSGVLIRAMHEAFSRPVIRHGSKKVGEQVSMGEVLGIIHDSAYSTELEKIKAPASGQLIEWCIVDGSDAVPSQVVAKMFTEVEISEQKNSESPVSQMESLLTRQVQANIWL